MISYCLVALAAVCNAVMDVVSFHFQDSVFSKYDHQYWNPVISWKNKYVDWDGGNKERKRIWGIKVAPAFTDAWHFFKSGMIVLLVLALVLYKPLVNQWLDFVLIGVIWNVVFGLFYRVVLRK